jgi:hypothetical protein
VSPALSIPTPFHVHLFTPLQTTKCCAAWTKICPQTRFKPQRIMKLGVCPLTISSTFGPSSALGKGRGYMSRNRRRVFLKQRKRSATMAPCTCDFCFFLFTLLLHRRTGHSQKMRWGNCDRALSAWKISRWAKKRGTSCTRIAVRLQRPFRANTNVLFFAVMHCQIGHCRVCINSTQDV